jgi:hypothetical protein
VEVPERSVIVPTIVHKEVVELNPALGDKLGGKRSHNIQRYRLVEGVASS